MGERLPRVAGRNVLAALKRNGWVESRPARGAHFYPQHPNRGSLVTVPVHGTEILPLPTLRGILTQTGLTVAELTEML